MQQTQEANTASFSRALIPTNENGTQRRTEAGCVPTKSAVRSPERRAEPPARTVGSGHEDDLSGGWAKWRDASFALARRRSPAARAEALDAVYRAEAAWKGGRADVRTALEQATREVAAG